MSNPLGSSEKLEPRTLPFLPTLQATILVNASTDETGPPIDAPIGPSNHVSTSTRSFVSARPARGGRLGRGGRARDNPPSTTSARPEPEVSLLPPHLRHDQEEFARGMALYREEQQQAADQEHERIANIQVVGFFVDNRERLARMALEEDGDDDDVTVPASIDSVARATNMAVEANAEAEEETDVVSVNRAAQGIAHVNLGLARDVERLGRALMQERQTVTRERQASTAEREAHASTQETNRILHTHNETLQRCIQGLRAQIMTERRSRNSSANSDLLDMDEEERSVAGPSISNEYTGNGSHDGLDTYDSNERRDSGVSGI